MRAGTVYTVILYISVSSLCDVRSGDQRLRPVFNVVFIGTNTPSPFRFHCLLFLLSLTSSSLGVAGRACLKPNKTRAKNCWPLPKYIFYSYVCVMV
jgi:hypothetical protein